MTSYLHLNYGDKCNLCNKETKAIIDMDRTIADSTGQQADDSALDPSNLVHHIVSKIQFHPISLPSNLYYELDPIIVRIGQFTEQWQAIIFVEWNSKCQQGGMSFSVIARIEDKWSAAIHLRSKSVQDHARAAARLNILKEQTEKERGMFYELKMLKDTLSLLDRDGCLSTVHELAMRRAEILLNGKESTSLLEVAKKNGDAQLIPAVTSHSFLLEAQNHLDQGKIFCQLQESLARCKAMENQLLSSQDTIASTAGEAKGEMISTRIRNERREQSNSASWNVETQGVQDCSKASNDFEERGASSHELMDPELEAENGSILKTDDNLNTLNMKTLDQVIKERNHQRNVLSKEIKHLLDHFLACQEKLSKHVNNASNLLCKLDGHLKESKYRKIEVFLGKNDGEANEFEVKSPNLDSDLDECESLILEIQRLVQSGEADKIISSAIYNVEAWLSRMEQLISSAACTRENAAAEFAKHLSFVVKLLEISDPNAISSVVNGMKIKPLSGSHKMLEMSFLHETEVLCAEEVVSTFPFRSIVHAVYVAQSRLDIELADLQNIPPEVERFRHVLDEIEPWVLKDPGEMMLNLNLLYEDYMTKLDLKDEIDAKIKKAKRRQNSSDFEIIEAEMYNLERQLAFDSEDLNLLIEESLRTTWRHFPENHAALENILQKIKWAVDINTEDSINGFICTNGILKKRSRFMYVNEQPLIEQDSGARHNVIKCNFVADDQKTLVLKEFRRQLAGKGKELYLLSWWRGFIREVGSLSRIRHPNIVEILCCFFEQSSDGPVAYIEMPYYEGGTLSNWMTLKPTHPQICRVLHQILQGIEFIHDNRVIHCDIKPANILMKTYDASATPLIADFDVSRTCDQRCEFARTATLSGSIQYLAPELSSSTGMSSITPKVDIYSCGMMMFEIFCPTQFQQRGVLQDPIITVDDNPEIESILKKMLEKVPSNRISAKDALQENYFLSNPAIRPAQDVLTETLAARQVLSQNYSDAHDRLRELQKEEHDQGLKIEDARKKLMVLKDDELKLENGSKLTKIIIAEREKVDAQLCSLNSELLKLKAEQETVNTLIQKLEREQEELEARDRIRENQDVITTAPAHWKMNSIQWARPATANFKIDVTDDLKLQVQELFDVSRNIYSEYNLKGSFKVTRVHRLENPKLWMQYALQRKNVREKVDAHNAHVVNPEYSSKAEWTKYYLDRNANEVFLFHGTAPDCADTIANMGFDERVFKLEGLFGAGIYFADCVDKSYAYCKRTSSANKYCMFVARVVLGIPFEAVEPKNRARRPPHMPDKPELFFDSVIGVTKKTHSNAYLERYREFVVYDRRQTYPELLVEFTYNAD